MTRCDTVAAFSFIDDACARTTIILTACHCVAEILTNYNRLEAAVLAGRERRGHGDCAVVKRRRLKPIRTTCCCTCFRITMQLYRVQERWQLAEGAET